MINQIIIISILLLTQISCLGQANPGPKLTALGINTAAVGDNLNIHTNPAHILSVRSPTAASAYISYALGELSEQMFNLIWPVQLTNLAIGVYRYGINGFNDTEASLAVARRFDKLNVGIKLNYHQLVIANYGSAKYFSADVGLSYVIDSLFTLGIYVARLGAKKPEYESINISNNLCVGFAYQISDKVLVAANASHNEIRQTDFGLGIEFRFIPQLGLRGGITVNPFKQYAGVGISVNKLNIDLAIAAMPILTHNLQIGISYAF